MPLTAKYPTTCGICSSSVSPGDEIAKAGGRWAHVACASSGAASGSGSGSAGQAGDEAGQQLLVPPVGRVATKRAAPGASASATTARTAKVVKPSMPEAEGALEVWTDGACSGNPGPGGWAWATKDGRQGSGGAPATTNQRMEVQAALEAIRALDGPLVVVSDSTYVVNCFRDGWWKGWLARGWVNTAKKPVANRDLWEPLISLFTERGNVSFRWVKGHSGDQMNDLVDQLAVAAGKALSAR